jgi:hypothetical protein
VISCQLKTSAAVGVYRLPLLRLGRALDFADGAGVFGYLAIGGEQGDAFDGGLGDEETVEWVLVDGRKTVDRDGVFAGDGKFRISIIEQSAAKFPAVYWQQLNDFP